MSNLLIATLVVTILVTTGLLLPLLWQLRKTAVSLERFFDSATKDLHQVATDVHEARAKLDVISESVRVSAENFASFSRSIAGVGSTLMVAGESLMGARAVVTKTMGGVIGAMGAGFSLASFFRKRRQRKGAQAHGG